MNVSRYMMVQALRICCRRKFRKPLSIFSSVPCSSTDNAAFWPVHVAVLYVSPSAVTQ